MTTTLELFLISGLGISGMLSLRILEIKLKRRIVLSHITVFVEDKLEPIVKKVLDFKDAQIERFHVLRVDTLHYIKAFIERSIESSKRYAEDFQEMNRGKRLLSRGSVSFFLLNIADNQGSNQEKASHEQFSKQAFEEAIATPVEELVEK